MEFQGKLLWWGLLGLSGVLVLLYLYFTLFPGGINPAAWEYFTTEEVRLGRNYRQVQQLVYIFSFVAEAGVLTWLILSGRAENWSNQLLWNTNGRFYLALFLFFLFLWLILRLVNLPFSLYEGFYLQHQWGFSTQTLWGWWGDYLKGSVISLVLSGLGVLFLFWSTGRWPSYWWLFAAGFLSVWLLVQSFFWPLVVAPLFNRFEPVTDRETLQIVHRLAEQADLPVDRVLVMDASKRTKKANAYFTGVGSVKRIVLFDTLLNNYSSGEVEAVIAHEMAHWKKGHLVRGILYGILGMFILWLLFFVILFYSYGSLGKGPYAPHVWASTLLFFLLISFVTSPLQNSISRSMEREADRLAVELTGNARNAVLLQVNLARKNLADVSPPAFIEWFAYSHPSTLHRIELINSKE